MNEKKTAAILSMSFFHLTPAELLVFSISLRVEMNPCKIYEGLQTLAVIVLSIKTRC